MTKMKAVQVNDSGQWEKIEKEIVQPGAYQVRIKVAACGVCHSDAFVKDKLWPNLKYPRVPGHEVSGTIDEVGPEVTNWRKGQRVGVGWAGSFCRQCDACRRGDFILCVKQKVTGVNYDGGYEEFMIAPVEALAAIPDELTFAEAAPLMCAGVTTFNALRHSSARAGDVVAIQGVGGLGHLAIQFANKMGFKTVAISKGAEKETLAKELGAHIYLDTEKNPAAAQLKKLGGSRVILATAPHGKSISELISGLGHNGELIIVGVAPDPIEVAALQLISGNLTIKGWASGTPSDSEDTLKFCALTGIRPMIKEFSLDTVEEAYESMITNKARFRSVIVVS